MINDYHDVISFEAVLVEAVVQSFWLETFLIVYPYHAQCNLVSITYDNTYTGMINATDACFTLLRRFIGTVSSFQDLVDDVIRFTALLGSLRPRQLG